MEQNKVKEGFDSHEYERQEIYACDICEDTFKLRASLHSHFIKIHDTSKRENMHQNSQCRICGKKIKSKLKRHIEAVHQNIRPFSCHICTKSFGLVGNFNKHLKIHIFYLNTLATTKYTLVRDRFSTEC